MAPPLLEIEDLTVKYRTQGQDVTAVSNASFTVREGEYFGLVGESGCGKTTLIKSILGGLDDNGYIDSGTIRYRGEEIQDYSDDQLNETIRWKEVSWIPQGSMSSLDPLQRIDEQANEIATVHTDLDREEIHERLKRLFDIVGLQESRIHDYPHQFSGGMQQRALIALALFLDPAIIVADEPTTALDVIMQDQVFKYLDEIKADRDTSMILVTHDISVVFESCDQMAIMHAGQVAERGPVTEVFDNPRHPYAILLQEAFPDVRYPDRELGIIQGSPPQNIGEVDYCTFVDRCPWAVEDCRVEAPPSRPVGDHEDHAAACIRSDEVLELYREEEGKQTVESDSI
jgi:oligopeptide/dipeptide ABC transporter ATP-binding protein